MSRALRLAYYGIPMLFCFAVHRRDLQMWFFTDDFAWLGLPQLVHSPGDLVHVLFAPMAQGTVRTLSERLFFLVFSSVFGLHSPPFRIWAFLTTFACIVLLMQITQRLTGSATAGFIAAILWSANAGLALAVGWSAAYNEIAFAFFVLLAFRLLLLYFDTGQRKYWIWQWIVFILGFGALELNVAYPALACGYALCCARKYFRKTWLLFIPSILFAALHFALVPAPTDPYYHMFFGPAIFATLWQYWSFALGALRDNKADWRPLWLGLSAALTVTLALALFAANKLRRREWLPAFLAGWFLIVILPLLPLKNHFTEYYVTVPVVGLAILGAWAIAEARGVALFTAIAITGLYLVVSIEDNRTAERFFYDRSRKMKYLITGLQSRRQTDAGKKILLDGVDNNFFWSGFLDDPFRLIGLREIYLTPGSEQSIDPHPEWGGIGRFIISPEIALSALRGHTATVYELRGRQLRDITATYLTEASVKFTAAPLDFIDAGDPLYQTHLGPTWYPAEHGSRWMSKTATIQIAGPRKAGQVLEITGYCAAALLAKGPLQVSFAADGIQLGTPTLRTPDQSFDFQLPLPAQLIAKPLMEIEIEVSRTTRVPPDPRELGLIFGTFRIK